jgi:hypothetical protein
VQIGKPTLPEHGAIAAQAGDGDRERLLQTSKTSEGRAPVRSAELEPGDGGLAAIPADDLPGEGVGLGRPGDSQLITSRPNNAEGIPTRAGGTGLGGAGSAWMPVATGCWLTAHADASDPSDDPTPREPVRRLEQREAPGCAPPRLRGPNRSLHALSAAARGDRVTALPNGLVSRRKPDFGTHRSCARPGRRRIGKRSPRAAGSGRCGLGVGRRGRRRRGSAQETSTPSFKEISQFQCAQTGYATTLLQRPSPLQGRRDRTPRASRWPCA